MRRALLVLLVLLAASGCIRRYAAPEEPAPTDQPYSAFAVMQRVELPPGEPGAPLPKAALRLAVGPEGWMADTALVEPESPALVEGEDASMELLRDREGPVVVLVDAELLGSPPVVEALAMLGDRAILAAGRPGYGPEAPALREDAGDASRDPLGRGR